MPSESRTVSISSSEFIGADSPLRSVDNGLLWQHRLGRSRIFQIVFANESPGHIHALGCIQNRHLAAITYQSDTASFGVRIEGLADIILQRKKQILIALLILRFGVFAP